VFEDNQITAAIEKRRQLKEGTAPASARLLAGVILRRLFLPAVCVDDSAS